MFFNSNNWRSEDFLYGEPGNWLPYELQWLDEDERVTTCILVQAMANGNMPHSQCAV